MASILIIDDEATNRRVLGVLLARDDHKLWEAANWAEAQALLDGKAVPDLVITDLRLTAETGIDVLRRLREDPIWKPIPVLLCSGSPDRDAVVSSAQLGAAGFLVKPLDATRVRNGVNKALATRWMKAHFDEPAAVCRRLSTDREKYLEMAGVFFAGLKTAIALHPETDEERAAAARQVAGLRRTASDLGLLVLIHVLEEWEKAGGGSDVAPPLLRRAAVIERVFNAFAS